MSGMTSVNAASMAEGIADLKAAHKNLRSELDALEGDIKSTFANWDGEAKSTYNAVQAKWNEDCNHMQQVIETMDRVLGQITEGYGTTENKIVSNFGA